MKRLAVLALFLALFAGAFVGAYAEDLFFDSDGVKIRYTDQGEGVPVVLIHGFTANLDQQWGAPGIIAALAEDYRVIALDNRGHGKSGKPHGKENYGTLMADDTIRLMDHLEIEQAHVAGYSMGGFITLNLLARHPERLITAIPGGAGWREAQDAQEGELDVNVLADSLEQGKGFAPLIEALTPTGQDKPSKEQIDMFNAVLTASNDVLALAGAVRGMLDLVVTREQLEANKVPTLAIIGEIDPLKTGVDAMEKVMANLKVVVIQGADHMTCFANPKFIGAMKSFLAEHSVVEGSRSK